MRLGLRRVLPVLALVVGALVIVAAQGSTERTANRSPITFRGDYETGDRSQWSECHTQNRSRCSVTRSPVRQGRFAGKFTTSASDDPPTTERAENVAALGDRLGDEAYYAWSTMFPRGFRTPSWANFHQFGAGNTGITGCVQEHFFVSYDPPSRGPANAVYVEICAGDVSSGRMPRAHVFKLHDGLNRGRWNDYVVHVRWSHRRAEGRFVVWHRVAGGRWRRVLDYHGATAQFQHGQRIRMAAAEGLYRSGTSKPATIYQDGFVRGTSFAAVEAAAFGS
ncbi:MAG: hypothetical protein QOC64_1255 [Solirubrobacteraceae bacterium]|jgi:hypothetical protein|nr:hypothetical protein [Solirubrobacteraceae bacterium]